MRYQGLIKRVFYTNIGVEADSLGEARRKIRERAEALPPDVYDYEEPSFICVKESGAASYGDLYSDYIDRGYKGGKKLNDVT